MLVVVRPYFNLRANDSSMNIKNLVLGSMLFLAACGGNTQLQKSWSDPETTVDVRKLNKVLVVAHMKDETSRRTVEDEMVQFLQGKGKQSYNILTQNISKNNEEAIKKQIEGEGFDGVVMLRLVDVEKDVDYTPGTYNTMPMYHRSFWPYYWNSYNMYYTPGHYTTTKNYSVETKVYSLKQDKLVFTALTNTGNPSNVTDLVKGVTKTVYNEMIKQGFLANATPVK
ncbi:MAG: hypothetical protein EAY72_02870 [Bacteroidetes bacterium]|nr:MAG: hypothetical protein EAY72_02870 [Bacteroidota bacterium]TAE71052.1 MAG: hypothetical protein EAY68_02135 [Bacteroidota bacterium]